MSRWFNIGGPCIAACAAMAAAQVFACTGMYVGRMVSADGTATKEVFTDFCHLTEKGYGIWREAMLPHFREVCGK